MKKFKLNNFIAFTLSEMMIVLLIFSVLSAAMLPSIIGKKKKTMPLDDTPVTRWQGENQTFGTYYQNGNTKVYLGYTPVSVSSYVTNPTLILGGKRYLYRNDSNIEFYQNKKNVGKLAVDVKDNIALGNKIYPTSSARSGVFIGNTGYVTPSESVFIGTYAGMNLDSSYDTTSYKSVNLGYYAGAKDAYHDQEVAIGYYAGMNFDESSSNNTYLGSYAGYASKGSSKVNIGTNAGVRSSGALQVNIGMFSGYSVDNDVDVSYHLNIGNYAGYLMKNTGVAMSPNVNIGYRSGPYATTSGGSVNVGNYAGYSSTNAFSTNIGYYAGYGASSHNTLIGDVSGCLSYSGNVIIGFIGYSRPAYLENSVVIGASEFTGYATGKYNVFIGNSAGFGTKGNQNTFIGAYVSYRDTQNTTDYNNITAVGAGCRNIAFASNKTCISATYSASNSIKNGSAWSPTTNSNTYHETFIAPPFPAGYFARSVITLYAAKVYAGTSTITAFSDKRLKENIKPVKNSLEKIRKINIYEYSMKSDKTYEPKIGVLAQELKNIIPEAVSVHPNSKYYTVSADWIMFTAIDAIKDLDKMVQNLQNDVKNYIKQLLDVSKIVENLDIRLNNIAETHVVMQAKLKEIDKILNKTENK